MGSAHKIQKVLKLSVKVIVATFQGNTIYNRDAKV